jgi:hypothetical protein
LGCKIDMFLLRIRHFADAMFFTRANQEQPNTSEKNGALSLIKPHKRRHSNGRLAWGARRKKIEL